MMDINRRHFIALLLGGAAGTTMTSIPWKLTDDIAIWTQNWPWVPVPPVGEFSYIKSICRLCSGGCGIKIRKVDERAVKIEGRTDYPVNPGGICPIGMGGLQLLYNESIRHTGPKKRIGPRGSGKFIEITWREALQTLSQRILSLRETGSPESLAAVDGNPIHSTMSVMIERFLRAVGSPNYLRVPSSEDTSRLVNSLMQGWDTPIGYDLEHADFVLSFGSGLLEGWGAPGRILHAWDLWHENTENKKVNVVQIESRASNTASKSTKWLAARPGTETALALGLAHVIISEGLYNTAFINSHSFGFEDWKSSDGTSHMGFKAMVLNTYSPKNVSQITGLGTKDIISLARAFARAKAPIAICGKGKGELNGSVYEYMAVHCLNALMGNINKPGGPFYVDLPPLNPLPQMNMDPIARAGVAHNRVDQAGSSKYPFSHSLINTFAETIKKSDQSLVDTLLVFSSNPVYTHPDSRIFKDALKKVPFIVSFSPFEDETSHMADLIVPDHTYLEKQDDIVRAPGLQYMLYGLSTPVVKPVYNTMNSGDALIQLAKKIGGIVENSFPWQQYDEVLQARAEGLFQSGVGLVDYDNSVPPWKPAKETDALDKQISSFNDMWKKLQMGGFWYRPVQSSKFDNRRFNTPSGKFEFSSQKIRSAFQTYANETGVKTALTDLGIHHQKDTVGLPQCESGNAKSNPADYPLRMVPYEIINLASGWIPSPPFLNKTIFDDQLRKNDSFAEINPETAADYDLKQGDRIIIQSPAGKIHVRVSIFEGAMPGVVYVPLGFGHTAYDEFLKGKGSNPNDIIRSGNDPLSGYPVWWNTSVQIVKV